MYCTVYISHRFIKRRYAAPLPPDVLLFIAEPRQTPDALLLLLPHVQPAVLGAVDGEDETLGAPGHGVHVEVGWDGLIHTSNRIKSKLL